MDCVQVGQLQLLRWQIAYELNTSCKFDSKFLSSSLQTMNKSVLLLQQSLFVVYSDLSNSSVSCQFSLSLSVPPPPPPPTNHSLCFLGMYESVCVCVCVCVCFGLTYVYVCLREFGFFDKNKSISTYVNGAYKNAHSLQQLFL